MTFLADFSYLGSISGMVYVLLCFVCRGKNKIQIYLVMTYFSFLYLIGTIDHTIYSSHMNQFNSLQPKTTNKPTIHTTNCDMDRYTKLQIKHQLHHLCYFGRFINRKCMRWCNRNTKCLSMSSNILSSSCSSQQITSDT